MTIDQLYSLARLALVFTAAGFLGRSAPNIVIAAFGLIVALREDQADSVRRMKRHLTLEAAGSALMLYAIIQGAAA